MTKDEKKPGAYARVKRNAKVATIAAGVGAVVGAAAALFAAPEGGKELLRDLKRETKGTRKVIKAKAQAVKSEAEHLYKDVSPEVKAALHKAQKNLDQAVAAAKHELTKEKYHDMVESALKHVPQDKAEFKQAAKTARKQWLKSWEQLKRRLS